MLGVEHKKKNWICTEVVLGYIFRRIHACSFVPSKCTQVLTFTCNYPLLLTSLRNK